MLKGKTVVLGVTGSIAAYKIANLASMLVKKHADVHVIMTENATNFINPITFETLTGNKCLVDTFDRNFQFNVEHVALAKRADVFMVAPAYTGNTFTCTVNIKCTTKKVPLYVTNECFELTVTHDKNEKNYAKQYINIDKEEYDLKESEGAKDFKLTITPVDIQDGDKVELKYWPRIQASSGNSGYTRAFCTWKMVAKKGTNNKIVLE